MDPVVILGTDVVSVGPGQEQRIPVRVRNQGRRVESYRVDVVGVPAQFAQVTPSQVSVLPGREAELDVVFRPPGGASTPTGTLPFAVRATSEVDASSSAVAEGRLELAGVAGLQAWAQETSLSGRWSAKYHLEFANQGNAAVRLALSTRDPAAATRIKVVPDVVDLTAGGRSTAVVEVKARHPFLRGTAQNRTLQADCQTFAFGTDRPVVSGVPPVDDPNHRTFQLSFQQKPILPRFLVPLLALVVVAGLALAVLTLRKTTGVSLDVTNPLAPAAVSATAGGPNAMLIGWQAVPNAEGYEVRQASINDQLAEKVIAPELPADQLTFPVAELQPGTKYCYVVRALGPDGHDSGFSELVCQATSAPTSLSVPRGVAIVPAGGDNYTVSWTYDGPASQDLMFSVLVAGTEAASSPFNTVDIALASEAEERPVDIRVQATQGEEKSAFSDPVSFTIPALPPVPTTASATTVPATATTLPGGGAGGPGGETTTTSAATPTTAAATTTTTPSPAAIDELQDLQLTWVAMLGSVPPGSSGGVPLEARKARLAADFGVPVEQLGVFTNRDTVAKQPDGSSAQANEGSASSRYVYLATPDQATADAICAKAAGCEVLQLAGAARESAGSKVLLLDPLPATATIAELDQQLDTLRPRFVGHGVYAVAGKDYPKLGTTRAVLFVTGFADDAERQGFCTANTITNCTGFTFEPV